MLLYQRVIKTPLGPLIALSSIDGLFLLDFQEDPGYTVFLQTYLVRAQVYCSEIILQNSPQGIEATSEKAQKASLILDKTQGWLQNYFNEGRHPKKSTIPLDLHGSSFAKNVWQHLYTLSFGKTQSYGEVAQILNKPQAARAVGKCVGENPIAIIIPCHRIIGKNGKLVGFRGGLERKRWLLNHEGHSF